MTEPTLSRHPLVLFDGVCNLCNGAVQWLVERDPEGRLHFASLQSAAAAQALAAAGVRDPAALPDSIVLVDDAGVHVRSAAALRIGVALGFPYRLIGAAWIVPRPLRDGIYRFIARNRYRWFGRRETCMRPTPELASRFLDAGEPTIVVPDNIVPGDHPSAPVWTGIKTWLVRILVVYLLLYMLPFPVSLLSYLTRLPGVGNIPGLGTGIGWIVGLYGAVMTPLTAWVGQTLFHVQVSAQSTGSGDRAFDWVQLFVFLNLAGILATLWTLAARRRALSPRFFDLTRVIARYYLATTLLTYGWIKLFPLQFPMPGPDRLIQPYGDSSPMGLAWTFLGASSAYQMFSGLCELLGGYLLFWRRTSLLGALVAAAVMTNVMAINYFYDVPVKLFSTHLFLVALFIAAPDLPRLVGLLGFNLPTTARVERPFWRAAGRPGLALMIGHLLLIGTITAFHITANRQAARTYGYRMPASSMRAVFRVESFERAGIVDRDNEDADRWVRVGINVPSTATVQRANGEAVRMRLALDESARTLSFFDRGAQPPPEPQFHYTEVEPGLIRMEGTFEGAHTVVVMRSSEQPTLLVERGYHWVNEFPFNR